MSTRLRIAVQKSGRLRDGSLRLLEDAGIAFRSGKDQLKSPSSNFPLEVIFLRDDDIPQYVEDGVADVGIVGENTVLEKKRKNNPIKKLGFAHCRLSIAVPRGTNYSGTGWLEGKNIATSYPAIVRQFLERRNVNAGIHEISGSVEIAPGIGLADAIADIVSTGSTLQSNGLQEVEHIMDSEAILIAGPQPSNGTKDILDQLLFRIDAVHSARNNKYILLNCPDEAIPRITNIIPGMKSPTIMPLARPGWSSLHSVVNENDFWNQIGQLKAAGAEGILVIPIEKMIA
ncbi:MAG: ATP phosphoribosyltransferase [Cyclobacteriaceae bacterium]|nr:ATP phosphoribosyltransferase [Cyclobacteriaceae bacterium]